MDGSSLRITNTKLADPDSDNTASTVGYKSTGARWRNTLKISDSDPRDLDGTFHDAVLYTTHELGHVFGLDHEHQRADASNDIAFNCHNLGGYDKVKDIVAGVREADRPEFRGLNPEQRMAVVCRNGALADDYLPTASDFMTADKVFSHETLLRMRVGYPLDFRSIMIYSSSTAAKSKSDRTLEKRHVEPNENPIFYMGGHSNGLYASISVQDIIRISELYPRGANPAQSQQAARDLLNNPLGWETCLFRQEGLDLPAEGITIHDSLWYPDPQADSSAPVQGPGGGTDVIMEDASKRSLEPESNTSVALTERWYSVSPNSRVVTPWPRTCDDSTGHWVHKIIFCWADKQSSDALRQILALAIINWMPVRDYAGLDIGPDVLCSQQDWAGCICTADMDGSSLYIWNDWTSGRFTASTSAGYLTPDLTILPLSVGGGRWRHYMKVFFPGMSHEESVRVMTHELGHVIGLMHEHQRPDVQQYLTFACENLSGYAAAWLKVASTTNQQEFNGLTGAQRMGLVCSNGDLANIYLPQALNYMPLDRASPDWASQYTYGSVAPIDDRSIMIYGSWQGSKDPQSPTLMKNLDNWGPGELPTLAAGGNPNPAYASISVGDMVRVATLYPKGPNPTRSQYYLGLITALQHSAIGNSQGWGIKKINVPDMRLVMDVRDSQCWPMEAEWLLPPQAQNIYGAMAADYALPTATNTLAALAR